MLLTRACFVIPIFRRKGDRVDIDQRGKDDEPINAFIFLGSGGHTGEMIRLVENYQNLLASKGNIILVGYSDANSLQKFKNKFVVQNQKWRGVTFRFYQFEKARSVGSGLLMSIWSVVKTLSSSFRIVMTIKFQMSKRANITLLNGPGTCCIITLWMKFIQFFTFNDSRVIYVESLARTNRLSLTGKILYPFVDEFVVQWPDLMINYPRARYYGILV